MFNDPEHIIRPKNVDGITLFIRKTCLLIDYSSEKVLR